MNWLLTEEEIVAESRKRANMPEDWAKVQLRKIVRELGPYVTQLVRDDRITYADGNAILDPLGLGILDYYWAELEAEAGLD